MGFKRHSINDVNQSRFYQMPKFLFEGEYKTAMSSEAKLLYTLLRDRHELSLKNRWHNEKGEVYLIFTRDEMCKMLGWGKDKILKIKKELIEFNLLEEERQGCNLPNLIFLNYIDKVQSPDEDPQKTTKNMDVGNADIRKSEKPTSGSRKIRHSEVVKTDTSDTNINETDISETNQSIYQETEVTDRLDFYYSLSKKKKEVIDEIKLNEGLPFEYLNDKERLDIAVKELCDYDELSHKEYHSDTIEHSAYKTFVSSLIELLSTKTHFINKQTISNTEVYNNLSSFYEKETGGAVSLDELREAATTNFTNALRSSKIRNHLAYMKACILSVFKTGLIYQAV